MAEEPENADSGGISKLFKNFWYGLSGYLHDPIVSGLVRFVALLHVGVADLYNSYYFILSSRLHFAQMEILFAHLGMNDMGMLTYTFAYIILRL